jgi:hypothetical protein
MRFEHLREYLTITVTILAGMFLSLYVGVAAGNGSRTPIMIIGGIIAIVVALVMQARIWLLIPLMWPLAGQLYGLPGNFPVHDLVVAYVFVVFLALKALKVVRTKPKFDWLDYLLWLNLFILALAFVRNPIGTNSMGLERIGGKAYFEILFSVLAYWVIHHYTISKKLAQRFLLLLVIGSIFNLCLSIAAHFVPFVANTVGRFYSGAYVKSDTDATATGDIDIDRTTYLMEAGTVFNAFCSVFPPFSLINPVHLFRFIGSALCILAVLKSGFRSMLLGSALFFSMALFFRQGKAAIVRLGCFAVFIVFLLSTMQGNVINLPFNIQRTLCFLPGKWDHDVVIDAQGSTNWRYEIWSNVWTSGHKYIDNWWFGDGFGMTKRQLAEALANTKQGQENLTVAGAYHSLPLTTIHIVGYVGLFFLCILMIGTAFYSWKLIRKAKGTPYYPMALFVGIPFIISPLPSLILTGFYDVQMIATAISIGYLRLIQKSLDEYIATQQQTEKPKQQTQLPTWDNGFPALPLKSRI